MTFLPHELLLMVAVDALGHGHHWDIELHTPRRARRVAMTACHSPTQALGASGIVGTSVVLRPALVPKVRRRLFPCH